MMTNEADFRLTTKTAKQKPPESGSRPIPSSQSRPAPAARRATPSAACAPSSCRFETWGWATTRTRPSSSSTAAGRVPASCQTTTLPSPTCWSAASCLTRCRASCGTTRPAAGPRTTRTWPSSTTRTAGTRWRSCQPPAAAAWVRGATGGF